MRSNLSDTQASCLAINHRYRLIKEDLDRKKTDEYMNAIIQIPGVKEFIEERMRLAVSAR